MGFGGITHSGLRGFAYRLKESISDALPGMVRIGGSDGFTYGPSGVSVAGFSSYRDQDEFGGGQKDVREVVIAIDKDLIAEGSLPKQGGLIEARVGDLTDEGGSTWRRFELRRIGGRGSLQRSWILRCGPIE